MFCQNFLLPTRKGCDPKQLTAKRDRERETERERDRERNCLNTAAAGVQWTADAGYSLQNSSVKGAGSENEIG